jgi:hypothetical protein
MAKPRKMELYLAEAERFMETVKAYRAAKEEASAEVPVTQRTYVSPNCNNAPAPTKRKSYQLPPLDRPTEIEGYPLNPRPPAEAPDYSSIGRVKAIRATQAARRGRRAPLTPSGPSELRKKGRGRP